MIRILWREFQTVLVALALTGFLWLYAESEITKDHEVDVAVKFVAPPSQAMWIDPADATQQVRMTVRCSTRQLDLIKVASAAGAFLVYLDPDHDARQPVDLQKQLAKTWPFIDMTIRQVKPDKVPVHADPLEVWRLPVQWVADDPQLGEDPPVIEVKMARVEGPKSLAQAMSTAKAVVRLDDAGFLSPGTVRRTLTIRLSPPPAAADQAKIRIEPATSEVTLTVKKTIDSCKTDVPLDVTLSPADHKHYLVTLKGEDRLRDVDVTGPPALIARIRKGERLVWATVRLTSEELGKAIDSKAVVFVLPPGLTVSSIPTVNFTVEERKAAPPTTLPAPP